MNAEILDAWWVEAIGLAAGAMTTCAFVPQVLQTWRSRQVRDISLAMYLVLASGVASWIVYGLFIDSLAVVAANMVTFVLVCAVLGMKLAWTKRTSD